MCKTITSINLSAFLAREQRRVLLVDMDPQGHATLGLSPMLLSLRGPCTTCSCGTGQTPHGLRDIIRTVRENLDVAPADILLSAIPEALAGRDGRRTSCLTPLPASGTTTITSWSIARRTSASSRSTR